MSKLKVKNLRKAYSRQIVPVKDLDLQVENEEFLTLVGPSGCGKSTILRLIAGLEQPTSGKVFIGDRNVTSLAPGDRNIAMVFQSYALYPHMTVHDNMASGLKLRNLSSGEIQTRIQEASQVLGLDELLDRKPAKLSGGQRQRVALGRALVREPDIFLLDEPLSNLDALLREQVRADLKQIFQKQKSPVVYVTHDQTEAMTLSSKVAVLNKGLLQQLDTPEVIYTNPANRFVAGFIGSPQMNLMSLPCQANHAVLGEFKIPLPKAARSPQAIILGIRPEHVRLAQPEEDVTKAHGKVFLVENLGMSYLLSIHVDGEPDRALRALLPSDAHWNNEDITLALPSDRIHWFHAKTEERIEST
ncbi:ABC transporter ATP-binding protein [Sphaerothrix gracilis]|uniref:ABC transporter ATP-binding protein n=1 Tax=Sphaerothrix gracilis TaxID=3151835 RepID=UPI0031FDDF1E